MNDLQRFPKWLLEETSAEIYIARGKQVCVRLFGGGKGPSRRCFNGFGDSVAEAAKNARKNQDHVKAPGAHVARAAK
jgi:hypothetical protein